MVSSDTTYFCAQDILPGATDPLTAASGNYTACDLERRIVLFSDITEAKKEDGDGKRASSLNPFRRCRIAADWVFS